MIPRFTLAPDPDLPGWAAWRLAGGTHFNAFLQPLHVRAEDGVTRVRMVPRAEHANVHAGVHGGVLLGFVDVGVAAGASREGGGGIVTLDLATQFVGAATLGQPLEARVERLRETGRLMFLRGLVVQGEATVLSFTATVRKVEAPSPLPPMGR